MSESTSSRRSDAMPRKTSQRAQIRLTRSDIEELLEAIDAYEYWQLSEPKYRTSGYVFDPGSDDPEMQRRIRRCNLIELKLRKALRGSES